MAPRDAASDDPVPRPRDGSARRTCSFPAPGGGIVWDVYRTGPPPAAIANPDAIGAGGDGRADSTARYAIVRLRRPPAPG